MFVFCLFETVCQCLEVLVRKCVFVSMCKLGGGRGAHVRSYDSYTTLGKNKHLKRPIYIHSQGSFINQTAAHLSTHSIFFFYVGLQGSQALPGIL